MPKPKKKAPTHISFRLKPAEIEPLDADRKALPGVPVARNTYAKHAVLSYPKLRKLEERVRWYAGDPSGKHAQDGALLKDLLVEAGL